MGRPALTQEDKRSERINLKLTKGEKTKLDNAARISGVPTVVAIREKLFKGKFPEPPLARIDLKTYLELKKIGVNVNQMTRQVNAGKVPIGLLNMLNTLSKHEQTIIKMLVHDRQSKNR